MAVMLWQYGGINTYAIRLEPGATLAMAGLTFTVNSTEDPGSGICDPVECTLREAINEANTAPGSDTIAFDIPNAGPHTIIPASPLPIITSPVVIDGYTQPGASANTLADDDNAVLMIELNGSLAGALNLIQINAGSSTVRGLVINRCSRAITMDTNGGNVIEGNFLGTNVAGSAASLNDYGVLVSTGSSNNVIGGTTPAARNLISGNNFGIGLQGGPGSMVQGNFIGTDRTGSNDLGNSIGVSLTASTNNTIGGTAAGARNVISGNANGIRMQANNNVILGNYIGVNATGGAFNGTGNTFGVAIFGTSNTIGGTTPAARNVISGHSIGISLNGDSSIVQGNYIGTDASGTTALGNTNFGISLTGSNNSVIGGTAPGAGNLISANGTGVSISGNPGFTIQVQGNLIGTDVNGTADLGNTDDGVSVNGPANFVTSVTIGGTAAGARNLISGNNGDGIELRALTGTVVQGNLIGLQIDGTSPLGNGGAGINIVGTFNNTVGGTAPGAANRIAFNGVGSASGGGVIIDGSTSITNSVRGNSIFANTSNGTIANRGLGLDLSASGGGNGPTPNDACDVDTGPNNLQNFPVVTSAITSGGSTTVQGTLESTAATTFTIDVYSSTSPDPSAHGEGETYLGSTTALSSGGCSYTFSFTTSSPVAIGHMAAATATDPSGNTSEFSNTRQVLSPTAGLSSISGRITTSDEVPLGGVLMSLTGGNGLRRTFTNSQGFYQFPNLVNSFYSVSTMRANYAFAPAERSFSLLANKTDADFVAHALPQTTNPLDSPEFFVRQQYLDFLGREPDEAGLQFWTNEITACSEDAQCVARKRENVSAAFFLSIEFQQTGFLVHRLYKTAFGRAPRLVEFLPDAQTVGRDVVVGSQGWEEQLAANQRALADSFVRREDFRLFYDSLSNEQYVDKLYQNTGVTPDQTDRNALVAGLNTGAETRATALRRIAESEALTHAEFRPAFVLMEYIGYLRRNPDDLPDSNLDGFDFWLTKLNSFGGDFVRAEMVKSFLVSTEYRRRFGV